MHASPDDLGNTHHAGLATAIQVYAADPIPTNAGRVLAQLLYGFVLLDSTGAAPQPVDGFLPAGSTFGIGVVVGDDEKPGLAIYSSNAELQAAHPELRSDQLYATVVESTDALGMVGVLGLDFLLIDKAGTAVRFPAEMVASGLAGPVHVRLRAALARPPVERHAAVKAVLADPLPGDQLAVAAVPETVGPNGDLSRMVLRTASNAEGSQVLLAFTSFVEASLGCPGGPYFAQPVENVRQIATNNGLSGVLLNIAIDSDVLIGAELESLAPPTAQGAGAN